MNNGDVIKFNRRGYTHYAIFIKPQPVAGNGVVENSVIHWWKDVGMLEPSVLITPFQGLADNVTHETGIIEAIGIDFNQVVQRAMAFKQRLDDLRMEGIKVSDLFDNSHHFVDWCRNRLGRIIITQEEILAVRDPWKFVHGSVTNTLNTVSIPNTMERLSKFQAGNIIRFFRRDYEHWALCLRNQGGIQYGIHLWDRDSVAPPTIEIQELTTIAGYCQVEIDQYNVNGNGELAASRAVMFRHFVAHFPDIIRLFHDSRQFAYFCCFGLGIQTEPEFDRFIGMADEAPVREVVEGLIQTSAPDVIRRNHNDAIRETLTEGDLIKLSQGSQEYFGLYIVQQDIPRVMGWMENGPPAIMVDNFDTLAAHMKVVRELRNEDYTETHNLVEMVNRAKALRTKINTTDDNYIGLFANSKHFAVWIFDTYGPKDARITVEEIARVDVWQHIYNLKGTKPQREKALIRQRNKRVLDALRAGDLVMFQRTIFPGLIKYDHYAVYIANSDESGALSVIHWWNDPNNNFSLRNSKASVRIDSFWTVAGYDETEEGNNDELENSHIDGHTVVATALKAQKEEDGETYDLLTNNCEHFANMCRYGVKRSRQVNSLSAIARGSLHVITSARHYLGRN